MPTTNTRPAFLSRHSDNARAYFMYGGKTYQFAQMVNRQLDGVAGALYVAPCGAQAVHYADDFRWYPHLTGAAAEICRPDLSVAR
jgi:hypothetical protein